MAGGDREQCAAGLSEEGERWCGMMGGPGTIWRRSGREGRSACFCSRESASAAGANGPGWERDLWPAGRKWRRAPVPVRPRDVIVLFNGRDLSGLSHWLKDTKESDPRGVFRVQDGLLRISGEGDGYIATRETYRDYHLIVEYKWGKRTDGGKFVRNSGILLHARGPDGGAERHVDVVDRMPACSGVRRRSDPDPGKGRGRSGHPGADHE